MLVTFPNSPYELFKPFEASGDQPEAIDKLVEGLSDGLAFQTLLGVTGSGKTFTMANVIARTGRPALVLAPNKTLAAQLYSEFREFFPNNAVEYFVSYFDYYQPEAYIPRTDTYVEKDSSVNDEIERHARVRIRYQDLDGNPQTEESEGLRAVCHQHEIDQLNGIFWIRRLSRLKRERLIKRFEKVSRS